MLAATIERQRLRVDDPEQATHSATGGSAKSRASDRMMLAAIHVSSHDDEVFKGND